MAYSLKYIQVFDDINDNNIEEISKLYKRCSKAFEKSLSMPSYEYSERTLNELRKIDKITEGIAVELLNKLSGVKIDISKDLATGIEQEMELLIKNKQAFISIFGKLLWWFSNDFKGLADGLEHEVYVGFTPNNHEMYAFYLLSKLGNSVVIYDRGISGNYEYYNNVNINRYNTSQNLEIDNFKEDRNHINTEDAISILKSIIDNTEQINHKLIILGSSIELDNLLVDAMVKSKEDTSIMIESSGIPSLTPEEVERVYRPTVKSVSSLINKVGQHMFIKKKYADKAVLFLKEKLSKERDLNMAERKFVQFICAYNRVCGSLENNGVRAIIIFGYPKSEFHWAIDFLSTLKISIIIIDYANKCSESAFESWDIANFEEYQTDKKYPIMKVTNTIAYQASEELKNTLYNDSKLLHGIRQCSSCSVSLLNTTFDELQMLWNEDNTYRPGFEINGKIANVPVIFSNVLGLIDNSEEKHIETLRKLMTEHTVLCKKLDELLNLSDETNNKMIINHCVDINGTSFSEQVPLCKDGKVNVDNILNSKNFTYKQLDTNVQKSIVNSIAFIINNNLINFKGLSNEQGTDLVLNTLLNIRQDFQKEMQWYDYTKQSPKLILLWNNADEFKLQHACIILLLYLCGWDILISSVNGNNILSSNILNQSVQTHIVGEYTFDFDVNKLENLKESKKAKKRGLFSWFSR